jgi:hypothetical protein
MSARRVYGAITVARAYGRVSNNGVVISVVIPCLGEEEGVGAAVRNAWQGIERRGPPDG